MPMDAKPHRPIDSMESLAAAMARVRAAQKIFAGFDQSAVDKIFLESAAAAASSRIELARMAVDETGMGIFEDKVIKNHYAAEYIYNAYKDTRTCGILSRDEALGITRIAEPVGLVAGVIPTTNPTSTTIFKALICLKTRNGVIFSPHPRSKASVAAAARIILEAAANAGAPEGIVAWIDAPSLELTGALMSGCDLILATGGPGMVKAAYSSGKPAVGVGAGNVPAVIDASADLKLAAGSIILSKTFDNGMICASEQALIVLEPVYEAMKAELIFRGCHFLGKAELAKIRQTILINGAVNAKVVGQSASAVARLAGFEVPGATKILVGEVARADLREPLAHEKLSPVLAMYRAKDFEEALAKAERLVEDGGLGHTASIYLDAEKARDRLDAFAQKMRTCRILVNTPSSHGGIGDLFNFGIPPSLTLGCGTWGGNSVGENVGVKHLMNIKVIAERRENMLWLRIPPKIYRGRGSLPTALTELKRDLGRQRVMVVTDDFMFHSGAADPILSKLDDLGLARDVFFDVEPDPTLSCAKAGAKRLADFKPDAIVAFGGGSAMDAAKIMRLLYEAPESRFEDLAMRFMDMRKRVRAFPELGRKAFFVAIPTTAGTGSEVTPFAVITEDATGMKFPLADYALTPDMAIIDADVQMGCPKGLTAASGIDAATHALEAWASMMATDYTDSLALGALESIFEHLPRAWEVGAGDPVARERMADAATMAGLAFANAFLGVCHSMAHKLGAFFHLPHGVANALMITHVMRFNASESPAKMGAFPRHYHAKTLQRYALLSKRLGLGGGSDAQALERLIEKIEDLKAKIGLKESIKDYGISENEFMAKLDQMSLMAFDDQCTGSNPRYPLVKEIREMYLSAWRGKEGGK